MCSTNALLVILSLVFPPLPVWIKRGLCSADSLINIALCCLGVLPGLLHSWYIILSTPEYDYEYLPVDVERQAPARSNTSVYYVQMPGQHGGASQGAYPGAGMQGGSSAGYGTIEGGAAAPPRYEDAVKGGKSGAQS